MKRLVLLIGVFALAGAVLSWCYAWLRKPLFLSEAVVAVGDGLSYEQLREEIGHAGGDAVLRGAARLSGVAPAGAPEAQAAGESSLRFSCVMDEPGSSEAFLRAWVESYRQNRAKRRRGEDRDDVIRLQTLLNDEEDSLREAGKALRGFLIEEMELSAGQTETALSRLTRGEGIRDVLGEDRGRIEKEILDSECSVDKLSAREEGLQKALSGEEKYIVTYQVKEKNPVAQQLREQLTEKQVDLQRLLIDSSEKHPLVQRLKDEIERTKKLLESKEKDSISEERIEFNPVYKDIAIDLSRTRRERVSLESYLERLKQSLSSESGRFEKLSSGSGRSGALVEEYRGRLEAVADIRDRLGESEEEGSAPGRGGGVEIVEIIAPARPHSSSGLRELIAVGIFSGAVAGLLFGLLLPYFRRSLSSKLN